MSSKFFGLCKTLKCFAFLVKGSGTTNQQAKQIFFKAVITIQIFIQLIAVNCITFKDAAVQKA